MNEFGRTIAYLRKSKRLPGSDRPLRQVDLCDIIGCTPGYLSQIEGGRDPSLVFFRKLYGLLTTTGEEIDEGAPIDPDKARLMVSALVGLEIDELPSALDRREQFATLVAEKVVEKMRSG